jgi:hypothetical protein
MSKELRIMFSLLLIVLALIPWVETIVSLVSQNISDTAPAPPYESISAIEDTGFGWRLYWHVVMLAVFSVILYRNDVIAIRIKVIWAAGLLFLWPIVSVVFVVKNVWRAGTVSGGE